MKICPWPLFAALILSGCISKTKYDLELENIEKVYVRIDRMTHGMNQMGDEINRLRDLQSDHKKENEVVIKKLRIEELQPSDVEDELVSINEAVKAYEVHHAAGDKLVDHFRDLKVKGEEALTLDGVHFLAQDNQVGFVLETSIFAPANSPKIDEARADIFSTLATPLNEFDTSRYHVVAHVDGSMPTGKRYETVEELGLDRALNVVSSLLEAGVSPTKLAASTITAKRPVPADSSKEERAWARRIEIRVIRDLTGNPGYETFGDIESGKLRL